MTPQAEQRIRAAVVELGDALVAAVAGAEDRPDRLLSVPEAAQAAGIGRSLAYQLIGTGRLRSIRLGRRRVVPASAIAELARRAEAR